MSGATEQKPNAEAEDTSTESRPRWRSGAVENRFSRGLVIALASCILATLAGSLLALTLLPTTRPRTTLVSLYMQPDDKEVSGVDAPHPSSADQLFELSAINLSTPLLLDWRTALAQVGDDEQLVLHVSSMARIEHCQVQFYGKEDNSGKNPPVSLASVLSALQSCPAKNKLLVLEVHWPLNADHGNSKSRLALLNANIDREVGLMGDLNCHVLLSSDAGAARGMSSRPRSLMSHFLAAALKSTDADLNHDGRITVRETVNWAQPLILSESRVIGVPQRIKLMQGGLPFVLPSIESVVPNVKTPYPAWLTDAWKRREQYMEDSRFPWLPETSSSWGQRLSSLESRWRRGEPDALLKSDLSRIDNVFAAKIGDALAKRNTKRSDSLRLAADRLPGNTTIDVDQLAADLVQQISDIVQTTPVADRTPLIDKAIGVYVDHFKPNDGAVALVALLKQLDNVSSADHDLIVLLAKVSKAWDSALTYPVTDAISKLAIENLSSHRNAKILQLYRIQDRLGSCTVATATVYRAAQKASTNLAIAQRLVWNPGTTSSQEIDYQLDHALNIASSVLVAERSIDLAIRRLQIVCDTISADRNSGVQWPKNNDMIELRRRVGQVSLALQRIHQLGSQTDGVLASKLAVLRQASESLKRHWMKMVDARANRLIASESLPHESISTSISSTVRAECLSIDRQHEHRASTTTQQHSSEPAEEFTSSIAALTKGAGDRYHEWWKTFIGATREIQSIPSYRRIAERLSVAGSRDCLPVAIAGDLGSLTWDNPFASIDLRYLVDLSDADSIEFDFLSPATTSLSVHPRRGVLQPGQMRQVKVALSMTDAMLSEGSLRGLWLRLRTKDREQLLLLRIPKQSFQPPIDIHFGPAADTIGRDVQMRLWPDSESQSIDWRIHSHDPTIKNVIVSVTSYNGSSLTSAPLAVSVDSSAVIRFPPAKKLPATDPSEGNELTGELTVMVSDPKSGETLGQWKVNSELRDPRTRIAPQWAEFRVDANGKNRLHVGISTVHGYEGDSDHDRFTPTIRLELDAKKTPSLIDFGTSQLQSQLRNPGGMTTLFADDLRFIEGSDPVVSIPLSVNGDSGYYELEGRFPRRRGLVQLQWNQLPELRVSAPDALMPGQPLLATIEARNLDDGQALVIEVLGDDPRSDVVLWRTTRSSPRQSIISFQSAANDGTVAVVARRRDWTVTVPTYFGTGSHRLRVSTTRLIGGTRVIAEHPFLLDDTVPNDVHARAETDAGKTTIYISARPTISGIESVLVSPDSVLDDKKVKPLPAAKIDREGIRWHLSWPKELPIPERVALSFKTGAGKTFLTTTDLPVQQVVPIGRITGRVMEGSIPQPNLVVSMNRPDGSVVAQVRTGQDGRYRFTAPPGKYTVEVQKSATQRQASADVTSKNRQTTVVDLRLRRAIEGTSGK